MDKDQGAYGKMISSDKGTNSISLFSRIRHHLTSLIVIWQKHSQSLNKNSSGIWCDCLQSKHGVAQNSLMSKMSLSSFFFLSLLFFPQRKQPFGSLNLSSPNAPNCSPLRLSLSSPFLRLSFLLAVKESAAVWSPFWLNEKKSACG